MMLSPTRTLVIRQSDSVAPSGGAFGATRAKWGTKNGKRIRVPYEHEGVDLVALPWSMLVVPRHCVVERIGIAYPRELRFHSLVLKFDLGYKMKLLYVWPLHKAGTKLATGEPLALVEDVSRRYPRVTVHVHVEVKRWGVRIDPLIVLEAA